MAHAGVHQGTPDEEDTMRTTSFHPQNDPADDINGRGCDGR
jgi:hypothetical protein